MDQKPIILIVDDEPAISELLNYEFSSRSFEVLQATNSSQALELFHTKRPNAVLCDLNLPGHSGSFLLKEMKRDNPKLPFIFMTGDTLFSLTDAYRCGADDLFLKPFKRADISNSVLRMLGRFSLANCDANKFDSSKAFTLQLNDEKSLFENSNLLFGRHGIYVFSDDELPQLKDMINLELKNQEGKLATLTGCVRFIYSKIHRGYGLEIYDASGVKSSEIKTFFNSSNSFYALPLPDSKL
ncbi:MAG: response regulator [Pseudomonadota bacterium]